MESAPGRLIGTTSLSPEIAVCVFRMADLGLTLAETSLRSFLGLARFRKNVVVLPRLLII